MFLKLRNAIILSLCLLVFTETIHAQIQQPSNFHSLDYSSQYYLQPALINPAFAGIEGFANLSINHPFRRLSDDTNPQHYSLLFQDDFNGFEGGYGLSFVYQNKKLGDDKDKFFVVNAMFSGGFDFGENWVGRAGVTFGAIHYTNVYRAGTQKGTTGASFFKINLDAGILLTNNDFSLGFSVVQSNEPEFGFTNSLSAEDEAKVIDARVNNQFIRAVYFQALYDIGINNDAVVITPMFLLSNRRNFGLNVGFTNNNRNLLRLELGSNVMIQNRYIFGLHTSLINNVHVLSFMAGAKINDSIQLTASYDLPKSEINNYYNFEIGLGFFFRTYE